jgi:pimeloyl-ACP methyl ester carboxylesterase
VNGRTLARRLVKASLLLFLVLTGLGAAGAAYEAIAATRDSMTYPPPGRLVDVGGHRLHLHCQGDGSPVVVLEAGSGNDSLSWGRLPQEIAHTTRVCAYDRAGFGWSDPGPPPRTAGRVVDELNALLVNAGERGPYVLVGFSLGGKFARLFASRYPDQVAGVVFVDAAHEDVDERLGTEWLAARHAQDQSFRDTLVTLKRLGLTRLLLPWAADVSPPEVRGMPPEFFLFQSRPEAAAANWQENTAYRDSNAELRNAAWSLTRVPVIVLVAGREWPDPVFQEAWTATGPTLAALSSNSRLTVVENSGHAIHVEAPDVVVQAIGDVVESARTGRPLAPAVQQSPPFR